MSKVRVLHLGSASGLYGAERWILALINNLDPTEVDSFVGSIGEADNREPPLCVSANLLNVKTRPFYSRKRFDLSVIKDIAKFISDNDIQILHTHGYKTDFVGLLSTMCNAVKLLQRHTDGRVSLTLSYLYMKLLIGCYFHFLMQLFPCLLSLRMD